MTPAATRIFALLTAILAVGFTAGCTRFQTEKGLEPTWQEVDAGTFRVGVSTQSDVMAALGPPSQIITANDGDVFYYLHEQALGTGIIFIVYNHVQLTTRYDRAIFFFDAAGVLQDYAVSEPPPHAK
jgi:outer membrane protein assembly factor BamE (lipoprotein component of BamABCDE complex)